MTGLVPMHEYRRVVEERDALAEKVAFYEGDSKALDRSARRRAIRRVLPEAQGASFVPLLDALMVRAHAFADETGAGWERQKVYACNLRRAMRTAGFLGDPVICAANRAYRLTDEARMWLREKIPDAFPATKEPSR